MIVCALTLPCELPFYWFGFIGYVDNTIKYVGATLGLIGVFVALAYVISMLLIRQKIRQK